MSDQVVREITTLSVEGLSPVVIQVLGEDAVPVGPLSLAKIGRSSGHATAGIYRISGQARTATGERSWSAVVKALGSPENPNPGVDKNPLSEIDIYRSGAFAEVCGGVRSARYYALHKRNQLQLLWLEDLSAAVQPPWAVKYFIESARHIGQFNAHWPEDALPQWEWLNRDGFRASFRNPRYEQVFERFSMLQDHPYVLSYAPPDVAKDVMQLWEESDWLLAQAEGTSKGICHLDCHPKNLFPMQDAVDGNYTVAIDWGHVGIDCFGVDLGLLIASPITWLEVTPQEAETLADSIFDAYMSGLAEAGWCGNEERVRLTFLTRLACETLRHTNLVTHAADNDNWRQITEKFLGFPIDEICTRWGRMLGFLFACKEEALRLAKHL